MAKMKIAIITSFLIFSVLTGLVPGFIWRSHPEASWVIFLIFPLAFLNGWFHFTFLLKKFEEHYAKTINKNI